jgi:hypothetical protein
VDNDIRDGENPTQHLALDRMGSSSALSATHIKRRDYRALKHREPAYLGLSASGIAGR